MYAQSDEEEEFSKEDLELKWKEFLTRLNDQHNLKATLSKVPEIKENWQLFLEIDNSIQNDLINSVKPQLVSFLRKELKNSKINLEIKVAKDIKNKIVYTDEDKFEKMKEKNPSIELLKKKLNLDFGQI